MASTGSCPAKADFRLGTRRNEPRPEVGRRPHVQLVGKNAPVNFEIGTKLICHHNLLVADTAED